MGLQAAKHLKRVISREFRHGDRRRRLSIQSRLVTVDRKEMKLVRPKCNSDGLAGFNNLSTGKPNDNGLARDIDMQKCFVTKEVYPANASHPRFRLGIACLQRDVFRSDTDRDGAV